MNKQCARCEKTVYPTEELKCLDKVWHKLCFKCKDCGMALNMRTYKGFNKEPYCEAHIPKAKATTMAETPELKRIAENTKIQSNVKYHADFEKSKGKFTQVADDPETLRIKQNTKIISNVAYHGDLLRKAEMEQRRQLNENTNGFGKDPSTDVRNANNSTAAYNHQMAPPTQQQQQQHHHHQPPPQATMPTSMPAPTPAMHHAAPHIGKVADYDPLASQQLPQQQFQSPYSSRTSQTLIYSSDVGRVDNPPARHIGSVHDMDPVNHNYGSLGRVYRAMYDYEAQDDDEVSFQDGDLIINVSSIDGGWMTGEVQRTGQVGMLPANYVQLANI
ncbi:unnamed protein product [Callosobruchus maculatus]|uniref:SH3 domain-containing protein n=1 Tax=Callosobruchus maculatus TaxID=64391 RepID=A0A653C8Y5_CALMS|nr:unnamed protein product [Callosobruchus maculatus]